MGFIHSRNVCRKEVITFSKLWEECTQEEARLIIREEKMGAIDDPDLCVNEMKEHIQNHNHRHFAKITEIQ